MNLSPYRQASARPPPARHRRLDWPAVVARALAHVSLLVVIVASIDEHWEAAILAWLGFCCWYLGKRSESLR
jgi:hypothetical protein